MLYMRVVVSPCIDLSTGSSVRRATVRTEPSCAMSIRSDTTWESSPLGPVTLTVVPSMVTVALDGTSIGILPTRDIVSSSQSLPYEAHYLSADAGRARFLLRHHALRRGEYRYP